MANEYKYIQVQLSAGLKHSHNKVPLVDGFC